jgi:hypothetical protein
MLMDALWKHEIILQGEDEDAEDKFPSLAAFYEEVVKQDMTGDNTSLTQLHRYMKDADVQLQYAVVTKPIALCLGILRHFCVDFWLCMRQQNPVVRI